MPTPLKLAIAWILVAIPLGWGVMKTVEKSKPLFTGALQAPAGK